MYKTFYFILVNLFLSLVTHSQYSVTLGPNSSGLGNDSAARSEIPVFTPEQLLQDFSIFRSALKEAHPGLYRYTNKITTEERFDSISRLLNRNMSELEYYRLLNKMVSGIKCGHTKFYRDGEPDNFYAYQKNGLFPLRLYFKDKRAFVVNSFNNSTPMLSGKEVLRINGKEMREIIEVLFENILADGNVESSKYEELNQNFAGYYSTFIGTSNAFDIEYADVETGNVLKLTLGSIKLSELASPPNIINSQASLSPYKISFPENGVAIMRIEVFMPGGNERYYDFLKRSFLEIKQRMVTHLVIDLRDNEGGMDAWGASLYSYLATGPFRYYERLEVVSKGSYSFAKYASRIKLFWLNKLLFIHKKNDRYLFTKSKNLRLQFPRKDSYNGKVFILLNGKSFSVTSEFASVARDHNRAVFAGEESGGTISGNNSGTFVIVRLPNTHLTIGIPIVGYYMHLDHSFQMDRGVIPDLQIAYSVDDILKKKDVLMEAVLKNIHTEQLK